MSKLSKSDLSEKEAKAVQVNASELVATFTDYDGWHAPYDGRALRISLVGDVLFVNVGRFVQEVGVERFEFDGKTDSVGIDAEQFYEVLGAMLRRDDRFAADRAAEGSLSARHPAIGTSWVPAPVSTVRRRA